MKDTLVIFTYALAGFGHLRVTDALYEATPVGIESEILESHDEKIKNIHRFTTIHHTIRRIYEWAQDGPLSPFFTEIYKWILTSDTRTVYSEASDLLKRQLILPKKVIFVSTHFGIAHQLVAIKAKLESELGTKVYLVVQVTDDYAHPMWYTEGSDLMIVPSHVTKERFEEIAQKNSYTPVEIVVSPYPVNKVRSIPLTPAEMSERLKFENVSVPISGAAANLFYYKELLSHLLVLGGSLKFFITSREAMYTKDFLGAFTGNPNIKVFSSQVDSEVVHFHNQVYLDNVMSLEITKPSELTFKALVNPDMRGGVILLFTQPFGSQEKSNLDFLMRHNLIPDWDEAERLWEMNEEDKEMLDKACGWRGLPLPPEPRHAARFIFWCKQYKIFSQMILCKGSLKPDPFKEEVSPYGVEKFWELIQSKFS